jgi:hypothetical protein
MVERAQLENYRLASRELSRLVKAELEAFFASLNLGRPEAVRDALTEFVPVLVEQYGAVAATIAAEFYEDMRASQGAVAPFTALTAPGVPVGAIAAKVGYLAGHLWTPTPEKMLGGLLVAADKYVKQPGRSTIAANARRENVRWARVPTGAKTCSFCLVLASRDAVYATAQSAGDSGSGYGDKYHGDCDCAVVRIAKPSDYPADYLPDDYLAKYEAARDAAGGTDIKSVAAAMRREFPDAVRDGVHAH